MAPSFISWPYFDSLKWLVITFHYCEKKPMVYTESSIVLQLAKYFNNRAPKQRQNPIKLYSISQEILNDNGHTSTDIDYSMPLSTPHL